MTYKGLREFNRAQRGPLRDGNFLKGYEGERVPLGNSFG
jgi:hypothetical protein